MKQTCALIAPVQPILHQVSCSNETLTKAPKHYETHQNMSLGSNWVDRCVRCEKIQCDFMARPCALIAPLQAILHRVSCSSEILPNAPNTMKHTKTGVQGRIGWIGCVHCEKFQCDFMPRICELILPFHPTLHRVSYSNETLQNAPKHNETHQNMNFGSSGMDRVGSL